MLLSKHRAKLSGSGIVIHKKETSTIRADNVGEFGTNGSQVSEVHLEERPSKRPQLDFYLYQKKLLGVLSMV